MAEDKRQKEYDAESTHGIQNAQARYEEHAENRLLRTELLRREDENEKGVAEEEAHARAENQLRQLEAEEEEELEVRRIRTQRIMQDEVRKSFEAVGEKLNGAEMQEILAKPPIKPSFPHIILALAVFKDILDVPAYFSFIGIIVVWFTTFFISLILFLWVLGYASGRTINRGLGRLGIGAVVEVFFGFVPATTIFVLVTYHSERKLWKLRTEAREKLSKSGLV